MDTILTIDLGKNKSVFCELDRSSLKLNIISNRAFGRS